jgi:nickel/cobalt exporter
MRSNLGTSFRAIVVCAAASLALSAHPMGNFSVNHYSRLHLRDGAATLTYVLDLAEIPTFELFGQWQIDGKDQAALAAKSKAQAEEWMANLSLQQGGQPATLRLISVLPRTTEGAGGMPVLRISITAEAKVQPGEVTYEDRNFAGRAGWKEIVVDHDRSAVIRDSSQGAKDLSAGLTTYPTDPAITPPQALRARLTWMPAVAIVRPKPDDPQAKTVDSQTEPPAPFSQQQPVAPGTVVRGDFLSRLLQHREIGWGMILIGVLAAFGLGSMHALSPGHGKTIVAAYLVGSRGTLKHAGLLGFVVTFTHTFTVFLLGLGVLFFQKYVMPEKIVPVLGVISGLSIVSVGALLLYRRAKALMVVSEPADAHHHHDPDHNHNHEHPHVHVHEHAHELVAAGHHHDHDHDPHHDGHHHDHGHDHPHGHDHQHGHDHHHHNGHEHHHDHDHHPAGLAHSHGGHTHSHMVEGKVTLGSLIALGVSGGMVPCPSALILMLSAIALGHPGFGLILLTGFSAGLAVVLMSIGMLVIYAKHLLPDSRKTMNRPLFRLVPVFSAVVVICLGLAMTGVSAGWIQPMRFLS